MAELNEQQAQDLGGTTKAHRSRSGFWFGIIILFVVVGLAGAGFFFFQSLRNQQKDLGSEVKDQMLKQLNDYQSQLTAVQLQVAHVSEKVDSKDEHFTKALETTSQAHKEQLENTRKELTQSVEEIRRQLSKTHSDWLIADAEYLLTIAGERLVLVGDVHAALTALEAADQRLKESGDTEVFKVRGKITEEIASLKSIAVPDIVGTNNTIQLQQNLVESLVLLQPFAGKPTTKSSEKTDTTDDNSLLDALGVKHSVQPIEAILTAQDAKFIYDQLRVKLEMVRIALVQHKGKLYQSELADAKQWLEKNFAQDSARQKFAEELDKLSVIKLDLEYPDITSLTMLKDISNRHIEADKAAQTATEPKKPIEEAKPIEKIEPKKPVEEPKLIENTEPKKPVEEPKPIENTEPKKPVEELKPIEKSAPKKPVEGLKSSEKTEPKKPVNTLNLTQPAPASKKK